MGRGQLVFKGDEKSKKNKKASVAKHVKVKKDQETTVERHARLPADNASPHNSTPSSPPETQQTPVIQQGTGLITTSGTVVSGHGTHFQRELSVGDAILVVVAERDRKQEMRVITMCLSDTSLNVSSAFSTSLAHPTRFQFIQKPRSRPREDAEKCKSNLATSTCPGEAAELVYRERTEHGGYRTRRVPLEESESITREELLTMRSRKTSDKYC